MPTSYYFTNKANGKLLTGSDQNLKSFLYLDTECGQGQDWFLDEANTIRTGDNYFPKQGGMSISWQKTFFEISL